MWTLAFFIDIDGEAALGLSPTIRIRNISTDSILVNDETMSEHGDGFYKYDFTGFDPLEHYSIRCDGGTDLPSRYVYGGNELFVEDIAKAVWDVQLSQHTTAGSTGEALNNIGNSTWAAYSGYGS
jgi:hypothetical protein